MTSSWTLQPLQKVMNTAARLVLHMRPGDWRPGESTPSALSQPHWLQVRQLIDYKWLVHLALNGKALKHTFLKKKI